ncbi:MAG: TRAP transporter small permease [Desulfobacterales bacterium]|jgi:TRAP-type C4-dicarboxylate transport system permease small subunit|nr:TRAP transporter small permease [Desulfobacterales bacterium]
MECLPQSNPPPPRTRVPVRIEETLAGAAIAILGLITFANVVVRYVTNFSFAFTEEFSVFLMLFMALVGGASVMAKQGHLSIRYLVDKLPTKARRWTLMGASILTSLTFLLLTIFGTRMAWDEYRFEVTSPGLGLPTWIYTIWLPLLSLAILGRSMGVMIRAWRRKE